MPAATSELQGTRDPGTEPGPIFRLHLHPRQHTAGDDRPISPPEPDGPPCDADGCDRTAKYKGVCLPHYQRTWRAQRKAAAAAKVATASSTHTDTADDVDTAPVRAHLAELAAAGMRPRVVATLAGVPAEAVVGLSSRKHHMIREHALALMLIRADPSAAADQARISAHGAQRRVQALVALGWPLEQIGAWLGCPGHVLAQLIGPDSRSVSGRQHRQIDAVYRRRMMAAPTVKDPGALALAAEQGWLPPLAWDDIDRDAPKGS